jgi:hypothetical protein
VEEREEEAKGTETHSRAARKYQKHISSRSAPASNHFSFAFCWLEQIIIPKGEATRRAEEKHLPNLDEALEHHHHGVLFLARSLLLFIYRNTARSIIAFAVALSIKHFPFLRASYFVSGQDCAPSSAQYFDRPALIDFSVSPSTAAINNSFVMMFTDFG